MLLRFCICAAILAARAIPTESLYRLPPEVSQDAEQHPSKVPPSTCLLLRRISIRSYGCVPRPQTRKKEIIVEKKKAKTRVGRLSSWPARVSPLSIHVEGVGMSWARDKGAQATSKPLGKTVAVGAVIFRDPGCTHQSSLRTTCSFPSLPCLTRNPSRSLLT